VTQVSKPTAEIHGTLITCSMFPGSEAVGVVLETSAGVERVRWYETQGQPGLSGAQHRAITTQEETLMPSSRLTTPQRLYTLLAHH